MQSEWKNTFLGELVDVKQGLAINAKSKHLLVEDGMPLLRITDLLNDVQVQFINAEEAPSQCIANKEDLIYTRTGQVGYIFRGKVGVVHNNCFRIIPKDDNTTRGYLYWFLSQNKIRKYANDISSGSVQKDLNHSAFKSIPIAIPSPKTQHKIELILNSIEDKIELNRKMNQTLEEMAQALFKSWFVDFDPVHAKARATSDAELEKAAAELGLSKEILELFPSEFVESEMGMIPLGWKVKSIYDVADIVYGAPFSSKKFNATQIGKPLIRIRDLKTFKSQHWTEEEHERGTLISAGDLLIGMDAEFRPTIWQGIDGWLNQRVLKVVPLNGTYTAYHYFSLKPKMHFFEKANVGTTVIHLGKKDIDTIRLLVPSQEILEQSALILEPLFKQLVHNSIHNRSLQKTRDTLLPKLLSGELDVSNINTEQNKEK